MARDGWDFGHTNADLSKLPPELREISSQPVPLRPHEMHSRVFIFHRSAALNHPNGRVLATPYTKDSMSPGEKPEGVQVDLTDFSGRIPLVTFVLAQNAVPEVLAGIAHAFFAAGGTREELLKVLESAEHAPRMQNPLYPEAKK